MPHSAYFLGFEFLETVIFLLCLRHAFRAGPPAVARLVLGVVFGLVLELLTIYQIRAYHYGPFSVMVLTVPLAIGIAWGNQLYGARLFSDATSLPQWARPVLDAVLVIYLDLLVEPVATRLAFWDFGLPLDVHWFGTPYSNFWGFFWVVASFSAGMRLLERTTSGLGRYLAGIGAVFVGITATLGANAFMVYALHGTGRIFGTAILLVLAMGTVIALRVRLVSAPPTVAWQFALFSMAFFLGIGLVSGALLKPPVLLGISLLVCAGGALAYWYARRMGPSSASAEASQSGAGGQ
jgi:hypothetical protein